MVALIASGLLGFVDRFLAVMFLAEPLEVVEVVVVTGLDVVAFVAGVWAAFAVGFGVFASSVCAACDCFASSFPVGWESGAAG